MNRGDTRKGGRTGLPESTGLINCQSETTGGITRIMRVVALIGYRAVGKTTVARLLAQRLGWDWVDADVEIERRAGKTIAEIFASDGEPAFRELEASVTGDLCTRTNLVLASGGGSPLRKENRVAMKEAGTVVWLQAKPETIWERMCSDTTTQERRPNLTDRGGLAEIVDVLSSREPVYSAVADFTVQTEGKTVELVAEEILGRLNTEGK